MEARRNNIAQAGRAGCGSVFLYGEQQKIGKAERERPTTRLAEVVAHTILQPPGQNPRVGSAEAKPCWLNSRSTGTS